MKVTGERFIPGKMFKHSEIEHMHRYTILRNVLRDKIVLDAACGTGYGSNIIASVARQVYGIDISREAIEYASSNFQKSSNLKYMEADISQLPFEENTFDVVVSFETIEHVNGEIQNRFLKEIRRVLKPEGILIMSTPNKEIYTIRTGNQPTEWHVKEFFEEEFVVFLKSEFTNIKYFQQYISKASYLLDGEADIAYLANREKSKKGKFIIAVASNSEYALKSIELNSIYYYPDEYAELDEICQMFHSTDEMFCEEQSEIIEVSTKQKEVCIEIGFDEGEIARRIRIDPLNNSCAIDCFNIEILTVEGKRLRPEKITDNADEVVGDIKYFYHRDPQYIVEFDEEVCIIRVFISFYIEQYGLDTYAYMTNKITSLTEVLTREKGVIEQERQLIEERKGFMTSELAAVHQERDAISAERSAILVEREAILAERDSIEKERDSIEKERNSIWNQQQFIEKERKFLDEERENFSKEKEQFFSQPLLKRLSSAIIRKP